MRAGIAALFALPLIAAALPAQAATRSIPVPNFVKLRVEGPYTVRVHTGAKVSVHASGPQSRLDKLTAESRGNTLVLSTDKSWSWRGLSWGKADAVIIDITVPMLEGAELTGSGDVAIDRIRTGDFAALLTGSGNLAVIELESSRLKATVTGSGNLLLAGKAGRADMAVTGSGDLRSAGLSVNLLTATVMGSGDITVGSTRVARAKVMGSGDIRIAGRPNCTSSKMGSGEIRCGG
ncbi:hypothetical protein ASE00_21575 [Sphingomonas sp. Root710]|uniref:head GIN domain-containing protein n=1 Tax=Sphingomonas sp. Root710 TaxID=1736594 RepID=UPI0006FC977F|nr:head GIN domain-containing protein [Sphingomonas sp. Root710]KRB85072.1 hypothetical protein ASE00_21575 [Sphingomonas sp. Root710]